MKAKSVPPRSAEELLERYAAGERDFSCVRAVGNSNLRGANLASADLRGANLIGANLTDADLNGSNISHAYLRSATLAGANLANTRLIGADMSGANLANAVLTNADIGNASLEHAALAGAQLGGVTLRRTKLLSLDLSPFCDAERSVEHQAPSHVDFAAISMSIRAPKLKAFLQRTGMPEIFIEHMIDCARTLDPLGVFKMLQSTFISYGGPDEAFANKLNDALLKNGVTTFFFPKDAVPGQKLHRTMRNGVNQYDRVILICSKASLNRPGVLNEITETLQREARDGGKEYLIPITLDKYLFSTWKPNDPGVAQAIKDRVVADFREAQTDPAKFNSELLRLITALKK